MAIQFVVMVHVMVMKLMKLVQKIVMHPVNVVLAKLLTVMAVVNAGQKAGLVMVLLIVKISSMVLT
tara:strand:+ start:470 stop:667 length:198 start_codon:yes stop_codon:yes gene_type:complete